MGGLSRKFVKVNELRDSGIDPVILDAGDLFFSTTKLSDKNRESEYFRAGAVIDGYQKIGCDAINVGYYELIAGLPFLKSINNNSSIPFISANLRDANTEKLIFEPYVIIERNGLKLGIIGVTDLKPDTMKSVISDDYAVAGNKIISQIKNDVDILAIMVNIGRGLQQKLPEIFKDVDFIYTSGSTNMTRPTNHQNDGGPYLYSFGKQGKYMSVITTSIKDTDHKIIDVSGYEGKIKSINRRLARLQKKDPTKSLEKIYSEQANVMKLINQYQDELTESKNAIVSAVNTLKFELLPLNRKIKDDTEMLAFIDKSLATCTALNRQPAKKNKNVKPHNHRNHKHNHDHSKH